MFVAPSYRVNRIDLYIDWRSSVAKGEAMELIDSSGCERVFTTMSIQAGTEVG